MPKAPDPHIAYDPDVGAYRVHDKAMRRPAGSVEEKRGAAKASVSQLLAQCFGRRLTSGAAGLQVPAHLRRYVKSVSDT